MTGLSAAAGDRSVVLSWQTAADARSVAVVRTPGGPPERASVVFRGPGSKFADGSVQNGVRYAYEVRVADAAGNAGSGTVLATPTGTGGVHHTVAAGGAGPRLLAPERGAVFSRRHPPLLRWTRVAGARYYNVQLFRGRRKILSAWPARPRYRLERSWTYRGKRRRLTPGFYRWHVWPGFGPRSKADYGDRIGRGRFEIRRLTAAPQ